MVLNDDAIFAIQKLMNASKNIKTQKQLAKKLKVSTAYISKLFASEKYLNIPTLAKLQSIFDTRFKILSNEQIAELREEINVKAKMFSTKDEFLQKLLIDNAICQTDNSDAPNMPTTQPVNSDYTISELNHNTLSN